MQVRILLSACGLLGCKRSSLFIYVLTQQHGLFSVLAQQHGLTERSKNVLQMLITYMTTACCRAAVIASRRPQPAALAAEQPVNVVCCSLRSVSVLQLQPQAQLYPGVAA